MVWMGRSTRPASHHPTATETTVSTAMTIPVTSHWYRRMWCRSSIAVPTAGSPVPRAGGLLFLSTPATCTCSMLVSSRFTATSRIVAVARNSPAYRAVSRTRIVRSLRGCRAVVDDIHGHRVPAQPLGHQVGQLLLVFGHQNPHAVFIPPELLRRR